MQVIIFQVTLPLKILAAAAACDATVILFNCSQQRIIVLTKHFFCADVAQPDQARIVGINAQYFLRNAGNFVISIKASCIDSTAPPEAVFAREVTSCSQQRTHACCTFMSKVCDSMLSDLW